MKKAIILKIEFDEKDGFQLKKVDFSLVERIMKQAEIIGKPGQPQISEIGSYQGEWQ